MYETQETPPQTNSKRRPTLLSPKLATKQHQPNTHLNPSQKPRLDSGVPPPERNPAQANHTVANRKTHTPARRRESSRMIDATNTRLPNDKTNTAMHRIQTTSPLFTKRGTATQEEPHPNPAPPKMSPHTQEDTNQHTAPAAPHPNSPKQAHSAHL
jgi:hypothetical protein